MKTAAVSVYHALDRATLVPLMFFVLGMLLSVRFLGLGGRASVGRSRTLPLTPPQACTCRPFLQAGFRSLHHGPLDDVHLGQVGDVKAALGLIRTNTAHGGSPRFIEALDFLIAHLFGRQGGTVALYVGR